MKRLGWLAPLCLFLFACGGPAVEVDDSFNNKSVTLSVNEDLIITLQSGTDGGYQWSEAHVDGEFLSYVSHTTRPASSSAPGAQGTETFTYRGKNVGDTTLTLKLARPTNPSDIGRTFTLAVHVK